VIGKRDHDHYYEAVHGLALPSPILGGATRQESVRLGLAAMADTGPGYVLIHDAARPFVSSALIDRVLDAFERADAVIPLLPVADTLRRVTENGFEILERESLRRAQTPQGFRFDKILSAHDRNRETPATDDAYLAEISGLKLEAVAGEEINFKLTTAEDFVLAEKIAGAHLGDIRTGTGFDVHRFEDGDHVWLCGIKIPYVRGLEGHSDADAGLHAATDAILGAIGAGDIGVHFPPSDPQWRNAPSHLFLEKAASLVAERGGALSHLDITLICEAPKISSYRDAMRARVAEILKTDIDRVSVKATTTEGLGALGRGEGIAAQAIATVRLPVSFK
jgi:2-C-methyl-D-erythritol 4-phosphate cytidylyltransferase/2-C-methyl-D-erythritol 2,4-cyclodiphosphate synthase